MENQFGKLSELHLRAARDGEKTILSDVSFTAPFKVMRPFYEKKDLMTVMLLTASAGIMAGDRQQYVIRVEQGARMEFVSQAYEKIHKMTEGYAVRDAKICVESGALLYYTPLPTIPFADSAFQSSTEVELADETSRFRMTEILSCGRVARDERFRYRWYKNHVTIRQAGRLIYRDAAFYDPKRWDMQGFGMYEGFTHLASLVICNEPKSEAWVASVRELLDDREDMEGGVTQNGDHLTVVRILGRTAQSLTEMLDRIQTME